MSAPDSASPIWDFLQTILIGRRPHLAMILSPGEVSIRMKLFLPHWTTLSNCPSTNDLSAALKPHIESIDKFELGFPVPKCESGWYRFENYKISSLYYYRKRHKHVILLWWALKCPSAVPEGESQGRSSFRPNTTPAPASDSCRRTVMLRHYVFQHLWT